MQDNSHLDVGDGSHTSDITRINVTMEPVSSGTPTELDVTGEVVGGDYDIGDNCIVSVDGLVTLDGEWVVTNAQVTCGDMTSTSASGVSITLNDGATVTLLQCVYARPSVHGRAAARAWLRRRRRQHHRGW